MECIEPARSQKPSETFYAKVKYLAIVSKLFTSFPLSHTLQCDGRKLQHSYFSCVYLYDFICATFNLFGFIFQCSRLIKTPENPTLDEITLSIWLQLTCYHVVGRGIIQFLVLHGMASRFPSLFTALEEYHQVTGVDLIRTKKRNKCITIFTSIIWTIVLLLAIQAFSMLFFQQLNPKLSIVDMWGMAMSYMCANIWKELPMNMFIKITLQMIKRFNEIKEELKKLRERSHGRDIAKDLEKIRLQHAALTRIVFLLQSCYGLQLAVNFGFLVVEIVLQLFVFFIITKSSNIILLALAFYYLIAGSIVLIIVERLQRKDGEIIEEIAAFELYSKPKSQQQQIQLFTAQITAKPVKVSASGFYNVNSAFLSAVWGAVATYLVMMVQFAPYIHATWGNYTDFNPDKFFTYLTF